MCLVHECQQFPPQSQDFSVWGLDYTRAWCHIHKLKFWSSTSDVYCPMCVYINVQPCKVLKFLSMYQEVCMS